MQGTINGKLYVRFEFSQRPFAYVSIFYAKKLTIYVLFVHLFRKCSIFPLFAQKRPFRTQTN
mgnify:CR=1 FL=1